MATAQCSFCSVSPTTEALATHLRYFVYSFSLLCHLVLLQAQDEAKELAAEYALLRKVKRGRMSEHAYEVATGLAPPSGGSESSGGEEEGSEGSMDDGDGQGEAPGSGSVAPGHQGAPQSKQAVKSTAGAHSRQAKPQEAGRLQMKQEAKVKRKQRRGKKKKQKGGG